VDWRVAVFIPFHVEQEGDRYLQAEFVPRETNHN